MDGTDMLHIRRCLNAKHGADMLQRPHSDSCLNAPCCMFIHVTHGQLLLNKVLLMYACKASPACIPDNILFSKPSHW